MGTRPKGIWSCPSDGSASGLPGDRWSSYHYRFYFSWCSLPPGITGLPANWQGVVVSDASVPTPAQVFAFHENAIFHSAGEVLSNGFWAPGARINLLFLDGHVKTMAVDRSLVQASWSGWGYDYHWPRGWVSPCVGVPDVQ